MGFVPIAIGIIRLIRLKTGEAVPEQITEPTNRSYWSFLIVAAVTFSNGGDNIGCKLCYLQSIMMVDQ